MSSVYGGNGGVGGEKKQQEQNLGSAPESEGIVAQESTEARSCSQGFGLQEPSLRGSWLCSLHGWLLQ